MNVYEEVTGALRGRSRQRVIAFATGSAERLAPVFRFLARPESVETFETALELAWLAALDEPLSRNVAEMLGDLNRLPEARGAESGYPQWAAWRALFLLITAAGAVEAEDLDKVSRRASAEVLNMAGNFDIMLKRSPEFTVKIDPASPPPPGPLKRREIAAQRAIVQLLESRAMPWEQVVREVQRLSLERAKELAVLLPQIAHRQRWSHA